MAVVGDPALDEQHGTDEGLIGDRSHPLGEILAKLPTSYDGSGEPSVRIGPPSASGVWFPASGVLGRQSGLIDDAMGEIATDYTVPLRDVQAAYYFGAYAWYVMGAAYAPFLMAKRVPDISPENIWATTYSGRVSRIVLLHGRFGCLPDDPAVAHPDATVYPDEDALAAHCREQIEHHMGALVGMMRVRRAKIGPRALWAMVTDSLIEVAIAVLGPNASADALAAAVSPMVRVDGSPLHTRSWFYRVEGARQGAFFTDRNGCCLTYKLKDNEMCGSCPLRPKPERMVLMREYLDSLTTAAT